MPEEYIGNRTVRCEWDGVVRYYSTDSFLESDVETAAWSFNCSIDSIEREIKLLVKQNKSITYGELCNIIGCNLSELCFAITGYRRKLKQQKGREIC